MPSRFRHIRANLHLLGGLLTKTLADLDTRPNPMQVFRVEMPDVATADYDIVVPADGGNWRVIDFEFVKTVGAGGAANTCQLKNGATAITNAVDTNIADAVVARAGTISDAQHRVAAGGTLRVTNTKAAGNAAGIAYIYAVQVD